MNKQEFKDLDRVFLEQLAVRVEAEDAEMRVMQSNPFEQGIKVLINYKGVGVGEVYHLENTGDYAQWKFLGNTQI